tara:strand:+ start:35 stop:550 length:516 start_codon:yes stop_codon:yes gene_type:complete
MAIHVTPIPRLTTLTTPAFTLGTANAAGDAITAVASNSTLLAFDTTVPASVAQANATGSATVASRRDHVHSDGESGAKVWCSIAADGTLESPDLGISTVGYTETGVRDINYTTAFANTTYAIASAVIGEPAGGVATFQYRTRTTADVTLVIKNGSNSGINVASTQVWFGTQ